MSSKLPHSEEEGSSSRNSSPSKRKLISDVNIPLKRIDLRRFQELSELIWPKLLSTIEIFLNDIGAKMNEIKQKINFFSEVISHERIEATRTLRTVSEFYSSCCNSEAKLQLSIQEFNARIQKFTDIFRTSFRNEIPISLLGDYFPAMLDAEAFKQMSTFTFQKSILNIVHLEDLKRIRSEIQLNTSRIVSDMTFEDIQLTDSVFVNDCKIQKLEENLQSTSSFDGELKAYIQENEICEMKMLFKSKLNAIIDFSRQDIACYLSQMYVCYNFCNDGLIALTTLYNS